MDTMYSNINMALYSIKQSIHTKNGVNKYTTKTILSNTKNETMITSLNNHTLKKNPNIQFKNTNNNSSSVITRISAPEICKNTVKSNLNIDDYTTDYQTDTCKNIEIDGIHIKTNNNKNVHLKTTNKKQKNISFSNEKLWEINRVNQILHNKITNGLKPTYTKLKPSTSLVKATSTINRERKNKGIVKENEILAKKLRNVRSTISK